MGPIGYGLTGKIKEYIYHENRRPEGGTADEPFTRRQARWAYAAILVVSLSVLGTIVYKAFQADSREVWLALGAGLFVVQVASGLWFIKGRTQDDQP